MQTSQLDQEQQEDLELSQEAKDILDQAELSTLLPARRLSTKDNLGQQGKDE